MKLKLACFITGLSLAFYGCTPQSVTQKIPSTMGNASPVASPAEGRTAGEVLKLSDSLKKVEDLEHVGQLLLVRSGKEVAVGTVQDFKTTSVKKLTIDTQCGDITATESSQEFIFACPDGVYAIGTDKKAQLIQPTATPQTIAVKTSDGAIITGNNYNDELTIYSEGKERTVAAEDTTDQMIAVPAASGPDVVYRINRQYTLIQNVDYSQHSMGAMLRVGLGVGQIAGGENGMVLAADTLGKQFGVYLTEAVIRLHQTNPTAGQSPWDIAWDPTRKRAWVATTSDNSLRSYAIDSGTGVEQESYQLVADAQNIDVLKDGTIVAASATGSGLQVITIK